MGSPQLDAILHESGVKNIFGVILHRWWCFFALFLCYLLHWFSCKFTFFLCYLLHWSNENGSHRKFLAACLCLVWVPTCAGLRLIWACWNFIASFFQLPKTGTVYTILGVGLTLQNLQWWAWICACSQMWYFCKTIIHRKKYIN